MSKYKNIISTIGRNKLSRCTDAEGRTFNREELINSWKESYHERVSRNEDEVGLRLPQFGALSAIRAHWATSNSPATIVLPTGTGKSETMYATIISERIASSLIIVPSNLLREQIFEGARHFGILPKLEMISDEVIYPTTFLYKSKVEDEEETILIDALEEANIVVSTPSMIKKMPSPMLDTLVEKVEVVIFDEAHHIVAPDWGTVRERFSGKKILQFTATPFRNDGKKIDGKIIFNYGLALAQKAGYFKPIDFFPIQEFDERKSDEEIAKIAIKQLEKDFLENEYEHVLLARANTRKRADELYEKIYSKYKLYNPVVIHGGIPPVKRNKYLQQVKDGKSKIVVCVDMFGEGIDIPTLKIAAIHDKYKSLPITLQFIGRFARTSGNKLGNAKLITNVAMDDLKVAIDELYHQDADWNQLLNIHSNRAINKEVELDEFIGRFKKGHVKEIDLSQLKMKVSTRMFQHPSKKFSVNGWKQVLDPDRTTSLINEEDFVYVFIEEIETKVVWSDQKDIVQYDYDFFVLFFDKDNGIVHINETDAGKGNRLVDSMFSEASAIKGDSIYRSLDGINRLMIGTLGLKQKPSGRISFRMFAGADIKAGISEAVASGSIKSNLFGYGYREGERISIGCSYKGKIWMRWVERIKFWTDWCQKIGKKVLDNSINTNNILNNSLALEVITEFPEGVPYKISMPEMIEVSNSSSKLLYISKEQKTFPFFQTMLKNPRLVNGNLRFEFWINERKFIFEEIINETSYSFNQIEGEELLVKLGNGTVTMTDYLYEHSPEVSFIQSDGTIIVVQENLQTVIKPKSGMEIPQDSFIAIDWTEFKVDIKSESQGRGRKADSIQYATIHNIVDQKSDIIFDDDGAGEIADVVSIKIDSRNQKIIFHLYHCKYSAEKLPGARVSDLYEVCGQAEKSIMWNDNVLQIIQRMIERENMRQRKYNETRFEKGNLRTLHMLKKMVTSGFETEFEISIVQPGVSIMKITDSMKQIILATDTYLKDTYGLRLTCYFSQ
ncbi:DEAD/DEAH box helicase [Bacillus haynesii]|uniref:DEAD/DEAH box helicase n=1 Tax=Bacillus haynesii TaxID=1925021 RepID=UPI00227F350D|nr:DEAD/DEAH box helicase family protein [Bacillus haynesii]MCY8378548.1 DEAD/DEAH box helicase family protein [Bacillus haynesii]MEC0676803.1 DEAD/DEAH box helicase family protein [Bacillus haynesii]